MDVVESTFQTHGFIYHQHLFSTYIDDSLINDTSLAVQSHEKFCSQHK